MKGDRHSGVNAVEDRRTEQILSLLD